MSNEEAKLTTTQAKEEIERGLRTFRAFETIHKALTNLESLEQNLAETEQRVLNIKNLEAELLKGKDAALQEIGDAKLKADHLRKNADQDANSIAEDARKNASKVLGDAKEEAKKIKASAQSDLDALISKSSDLKNEHAATDAALKAKKAELDAVQATLNQHKASIEKFLKG